MTDEREVLARFLADTLRGCDEYVDDDDLEYVTIDGGFNLLAVAGVLLTKYRRNVGGN